MIYLIDDNKYKQMSNNYKFNIEDIINKYNSYICWIDNLINIDINKVIDSTNCILIHDSLEEKEEKEYIIALAKKKEIPYCIFSNGYTATIFDGDSIKEIKKDRFYNNLLDFIINYIKTNNIDLRILSLGQNYDLERASILLDKIVNGTLLKNIDNFDYEIAFPGGSNEYKELRELVYLSDPKLDFNDFENKYDTYNINAFNFRQVLLTLINNIKQNFDE